MACSTHTVVKLSRRMAIEYYYIASPDATAKNGSLGIPGHDREDLLAEVVRLAVADAVDMTEFVLALRLRPRDFAQRGVVKDDVGRHTPAARNFQPQDTQL